VKEVDAELTFSPPWDPRTMASEDVKMQLGIW
jgi:metal-sulfur cluster biosynthetic enzyme